MPPDFKLNVFIEEMKACKPPYRKSLSDQLYAFIKFDEDRWGKNGKLRVRGKNEKRERKTQ